MSAPPKVSIGLPVRDGEQYLASAFDTLLAQTYTDFELIVSDNGSTDSTPEICATYAREDARVRVHRQEVNIGAAANYNFVFDQARGAYFSWAAHDDERHPENIARCVAAFDRGRSELVLAYPRGAFIDGDGAFLGTDGDRLQAPPGPPHRRLAQVLSQLNRATAVMGLWRSAALAQTRKIDTVVGADYVVLVEAALLGEISEVPEVLFYRRLHVGNSRVQHATKRAAIEWYAAQAPARGLRLPINAQLLVEYHRSVNRLPLTTSERWRCHATIPRVVATRRLRVVGGRVKRRLRRTEVTPIGEVATSPSSG